MTFKDLAKRIATCYNSLPALIDALRDGFNEVEAGGGGGSSDIEYSTEEKKIGTWIDGKPLYQKTLSFTTGNSDAYLNYVTDIENPDMMCVDLSSSFYIAGTSIINAIPYFGTLGGGDSNSFSILCNNIDNKLRIDYRIGSSAYSKAATVTVRYTKSTDTPNS